MSGTVEAQYYLLCASQESVEISVTARGEKPQKGDCENIGNHMDLSIINQRVIFVGTTCTHDRRTYRQCMKPIHYVSTFCA